MTVFGYDLILLISGLKVVVSIVLCFLAYLIVQARQMLLQHERAIRDLLMLSALVPLGEAGAVQLKRTVAPTINNNYDMDFWIDFMRRENVHFSMVITMLILALYRARSSTNTGFATKSYLYVEIRSETGICQLKYVKIG